MKKGMSHSNAFLQQITPGDINPADPPVTGAEVSPGLIIPIDESKPVIAVKNV